MKMSYHTINERIDRLNFIVDTVGFGEERARFMDKSDKCYQILTTTGVVLVVSLDEQTLITAFIAHENRIYSLYKNCHLTVPNDMKKIAHNNMRYWKIQNNFDR